MRRYLDASPMKIPALPVPAYPCNTLFSSTGEVSAPSAISWWNQLINVPSNYTRCLYCHSMLILGG